MQGIVGKYNMKENDLEGTLTPAKATIRPLTVFVQLVEH